MNAFTLSVMVVVVLKVPAPYKRTVLMLVVKILTVVAGVLSSRYSPIAGMLLLPFRFVP